MWVDEVANLLEARFYFGFFLQRFEVVTLTYILAWSFASFVRVKLEFLVLFQLSKVC